jgi:hypothetical protein
MTTQSAIMIALLKTHLFSTQVSLLALAQDLSPFRWLICSQDIELSGHDKLYNRQTVLLLSTANNVSTGEQHCSIPFWL